MKLAYLLWGCALCVAAVPLACGSDSNGGAPAAAGETGAGGDGTGANGTGGKKGTGASTSGGDAAVGGADGAGGLTSAAGGETAAAGASDGSMCTPRASVPDPVGTTLKVQPNCKPP